MPYRIRKSDCKRSDGKKGKYVLEYIPKGKRKYKRAGCHTSKKKAHGQRAAIEGGPRESFERELKTLLEAIDIYLMEDAPHLKQYGAPEGSKRDKDLDRCKKLYADGKKKESAECRERMEKKEREKPGFKNKPRSDTKKESLEEIDNLIMEILEERKKRKSSKKKSKKKKKGSASGGLSAATKKSLDKKADRRGLTRGSVYREFRAGLAAWASSGSRKGMSQHQWAHARVNSATPSKSWAVVKKSKAKKKK